MIHLFFDHAIIVSVQLSRPEDFDVDSNYSFQTLFVSVLLALFSSPVIVDGQIISNSYRNELSK